MPGTGDTYSTTQLHRAEYQEISLWMKTKTLTLITRTANKMFHQLEVAVVGGIMQQNVFLLVLAVDSTLIHRYKRSNDISPAPVPS